MGRAPCCDKEGLKRGPWTPEEDDILVDFIKKHGHGSWRSLPKQAGLLRCGKSCRLRWTNYLRPDIKRGPFTEDEEKTIIQLHGIIGNRWASIAAQLPGRTDNEIKNFWNTHLKKRLVKMGLDPKTHSPASPFSAPPTAAAADPSSFPSTRHMAQWESARLEAEARLSRESMLFSFCNNEDYPQPSDPSDKPGVDVFLRIWNSEIGESFRSKKGGFVKVETEESPEPASPASSSSKHGSTVTATTTANAPVFSTVGCEDFECKSSVSGGMMKMVIGGGSDSSCSNELDDSSETSLHLLLNFNGDDEMSGFFAEDVW